MPIKPSPYIPAFMRAVVSGSRPLQLTFDSIADTNIISTSSFKYDPADAPLKSTQQLNVDWENFENHTFFSSAEVNVNMAFDQIINGYPFDGTRAEIEHFFERLTGFEKWVFDQFPYFRGQLHFSGTLVGEDTTGALGTYIRVQDYAGGAYPEISKNKTGLAILNPRDGVSMSIEMQLYVPQIQNANQVICQKLYNTNQGFSLYLSSSTSTSSCTAGFTFVSGTNFVTTTAPLQKGRFNHICVTLDRDASVPYAAFYNNEELINASTSQVTFGDLDIDNIDFLIGTGSLLMTSSVGLGFLPQQTFSGSIDEFRVFHSVRTQQQQKLYAKKAIFTTPDLKLYYRFNEPPPPLSTDSSIDSIVLDSSGNSLHATINSNSPSLASLRVNIDDDPTTSMVYEKVDTAPILFPAYQDIVDLNERLLTSASLYDAANPNLITRLIPPHYLQEGAFADGFDEEKGLAGNAYGGTGIPGQGKMGGIQIILTFLYIWARFFDEIKLFIDAFNSLDYVDYESIGTTPDNFLNLLVSKYGFYLPPLFNDSTIEQYIDAENIDRDISTGTYPLKYVQQQLLRRVLVNLPDVIRSKGTQHSIKAFLRAIGIDPENSVRVREYGGPTTRQLRHSRELKTEMNNMIQFVPGSSVTSPFLSASRVEVGFPYPVGTMVKKNIYHPHGISNSVSDGLLTSGSWMIEGIVRYPASTWKTMPSAQSLVRLHVTGSGIDSGEAIVLNFLAISSSLEPRLVLYSRNQPSIGITPQLLTITMPMSGRSIFDGEKWNFSFGRIRSDDAGAYATASYFLRCATQEEGKITQFYTTSSFFNDTYPTQTVYQTITSQYNASGCFIRIGSGNPVTDVGGGYQFMNDTDEVPDEARANDFDGMMSNLRFWSTALSDEDWREHVRSYKSAGVRDPLTNYNFVTTASGSFGRLRMDTLTRNESRDSVVSSGGDYGSYTFLDYSLNNMHLSGAHFMTASTFVAEPFTYSYLSPYFDEATSNEKVRVRGYLDSEMLAERPWAGVAPIYDVVKSEEPTDDTRFSIEFSLIDALNRDIVTMFSTFDAIDNAIGDPALLFSPDYPDLDKLREVYFNRIGEKLNFKEFFEFFRWFDTSIGTFIEQLIPRKTNFKGTNFVVESHMLERHKVEYNSADIYVQEEHKSRPFEAIWLQLITGVLRKY